MPETRPIGVRVFAFALGGYSLLVFSLLIAGLVSGDQIVSYLILGLDFVLVAFGLFGARAIYYLLPHSKWLFLGWLFAVFLIGLVAFLEMLALDDSLSAIGALLGVLLVGVLGAAGFRYLSRICRPAV